MQGLRFERGKKKGSGPDLGGVRRRVLFLEGTKEGVHPLMGVRKRWGNGIYVHIWIMDIQHMHNYNKVFQMLAIKVVNFSFHIQDKFASTNLSKRRFDNKKLS